MVPLQHFRHQPVGNTTLLRFMDDQLFESEKLIRLDEELMAFVQGRPDVHLLVDFGGVDYCSTALINTLLRVRRELTSSGGTLRLCGMRQTVRDGFRMLNLDGPVFPIYDTVEEGLAATEP